MGEPELKNGISNKRLLNTATQDMVSALSSPQESCVSLSLFPVQLQAYFHVFGPTPPLADHPRMRLGSFTSSTFEATYYHLSLNSQRL